jgi:NAD(P)H-dependent FMN reductase
MRVLALSGSLRSPSNTRSALTVVLAGAQAAGASVEWLDLDGLPFCDGRPAEAYGARVDAHRTAVRTADALLIGSPEYHGGMSGMLKNALDLLDADDVRGKVVALVATARGDAGAMNTLNHLRQVARWVDAWVLPGQVSVPRAGEAFGPGGTVLRTGLEDELARLGTELVRFARLLAQPQP